MTKREARRLAYQRVVALMDAAPSVPLMRPDGTEFSGREQVRFSEVFTELRDSFHLRSIHHLQGKAK